MNLTGNANKRQQQKQRDQAFRQGRLAAWRKILESPEGRLVLGDLLDYTGLFLDSPKESTEHMLISEGGRAVALSIHRMCLDAHKSAYLQLLSEILKEEPDD